MAIAISIVVRRKYAAFILPVFPNVYTIYEEWRYTLATFIAIQIRKFTEFRLLNFSIQFNSFESICYDLDRSKDYDNSPEVDGTHDSPTQHSHICAHTMLQLQLSHKICDDEKHVTHFIFATCPSCVIKRNVGDEIHWYAMKCMQTLYEWIWMWWVFRRVLLTVLQQQVSGLTLF